MAPTREKVATDSAEAPLLGLVEGAVVPEGFAEELDDPEAPEVPEAPEAPEVPELPLALEEPVLPVPPEDVVDPVLPEEVEPPPVVEPPVAGAAGLFRQLESLLGWTVNLSVYWTAPVLSFNESVIEVPAWMLTADQE
jgi:hypothetical protein